MQIVTSEIMAEIDRRAQEELGIPASLLMENAGRIVAENIIRDHSVFEDSKVSILCGKGNNGGDGFVAGRYLFCSGFKNIEVFIMSEAEIKKGAAKDNFDKLKDLGIRINLLDDFAKKMIKGTSSIIVDALFGIGFKGDLSHEFISLGEKVKGARSVVFAVDIPSGLNATTGIASKGCISAKKTVTFGLPKKGFYFGSGPEFCGEIIVADIGFPKEFLAEYTESSL